MKRFLAFRSSIHGPYNQYISTETRCNIGNAQAPVSTESKADQSSDSARSSSHTYYRLSSSRMLFPVINLSSLLRPHKGSQSSPTTVILRFRNLSVRYELIARLSPSPANETGRFTILKKYLLRQFSGINDNARFTHLLF